MAATRLLSDENCAGQVEAISTELKILGLAELLEIDVVSWDETSLRKGVDDETIWRFCQEHNLLLITGNRTGYDKEKSLEYVIQHLIQPNSLPVLTIGNLKRVNRNRRYCIACARSLADIVLELELYRGVTRLFIPQQNTFS